MIVSVIIPTLNEARCLPAALASLRRHGAVEIIVADGGSTDGTCELARDADLVLKTPRGRAAQMNAGATQARGGVLLFLHADCELAPGAVAAAEQAASRRGVAAGCFSMRVRASGWLFRCIDGCASARTRLTGLVYGDQGLFLRRDVFNRVGGFPPVHFMEDVLISRALRPLGRVVVLPDRIQVSPRGWQKTGITRQSLRNWALTAAAALGVPPDRLARFYPTVR